MSDHKSHSPARTNKHKQGKTSNDVPDHDDMVYDVKCTVAWKGGRVDINQLMHLPKTISSIILIQFISEGLACVSEDVRSSQTGLSDICRSSSPDCEEIEDTE